MSSRHHFNSWGYIEGTANLDHVHDDVDQTKDQGSHTCRKKRQTLQSLKDNDTIDPDQGTSRCREIVRVQIGIRQLLENVADDEMVMLMMKKNMQMSKQLADKEKVVDDGLTGVENETSQAMLIQFKAVFKKIKLSLI